MKVVKRDGRKVGFNKQKIVNAIELAMERTNDGVNHDIALNIANKVAHDTEQMKTISVEQIQDMVEQRLMASSKKDAAKEFITYRYKRGLVRESNTTDKSILELINGTNDYWNNENSNKDATVVTVQRDYLAGITSTDITKRFLLPHDVKEANEEGILHFHDADYFAQKSLHNCFSGDTKFVTSNGIKCFNEFHDGDKVQVLNKDSKWCLATVHKYGKQKMFDVTFKTSQRNKTITCTNNHRWILKDGTVTTNLKIGDTLYPINKFMAQIPHTYDECSAFALGLLIGDGCDHTPYNQIRLCGNKTKYASILKNCGYNIEKIKDTEDLIAYKYGCIKQDFLNSKAWKYMDLNSKTFLFLGLYAADGAIETNKLCTVDERVAQLIRDISCCAGYHITSETNEIRDTNYSKDSKLIAFRFTVSQPLNLCWKVANIVPHFDKVYKDNRRNNSFKTCNPPIVAWCVEEPTTHSFILEGGMVTGNCDLINLDDMLQNGTVVNGIMIEKPHRLIKAMTIATQIITAVASSQYGGCTITLTHLAPFVRYSYNRYIEKYTKRGFSESDVKKYAEEDLHKEIEDSVQTFNYQINSMSTTNGQAPFLSVNMYLNENPEYKKEVALLTEEFLKQRIIGMKNEVGVYVTQAFPKLLYVLEEDNIKEGTPYWYLTKLAAECTAKRFVPDYISEKIMLRDKGACYPCINKTCA